MAKAHMLAVASGFLGVLLVCAAWITSLRLGPPLEAWVAGATIAFVPVVLVLLAILAMAVNLVFENLRPRGLLAATLTGAALALGAVLFSCGPFACFLPGVNRMMGWFLVLGTALAAALHQIVLMHFKRRVRHG